MIQHAKRGLFFTGVVSKSLVFTLLLVALLASLFITAPSPSYAQTTCPPGWTNFGDASSGELQCDRNGERVPYAELEERIRQENIANREAQEVEQSSALKLFYYSMGRDAEGNVIPGGRDTCLSCDFIMYFMIAMATFSAVLFTYFSTFFAILGPILMAIWIAVKVIQLNFNGGSGGGTFVYDLVTKFTIFFFAWLFLTANQGVVGPQPGGQQTQTYFAGESWQIVGPRVLEFAFDLNSDVRSQTAAGLMALNAGVPDTTPFECNTLEQRIQARVPDTTLAPAITATTETACVVERMHILGIATSVSLIMSAWTNIEFNGGAGLLGAVMKSIWGVILLAVYALSMVWLVFILLDVVVKALIIAAFLPIFGLAFLFKPSRDVAMNAFMQLVSVPVVAFALGLTSLIGFYLIVSVPTVYNNTYALMSSVYQRSLTPIEATSTFGQFEEFIQRTEQSARFLDTIPVYITSPWMVFMLLSGLAIYSLGKKIIAIIEQILGVQGTTELADNAKKMALLGTKAGAVAGVATLAVGGVAAGVAARVGGIGAGAGMAGAGALARGVTNGARGAGLQGYGGRLAKNSARALNPFGRRNGNQE